MTLTLQSLYKTILKDNFKIGCVMETDKYYEIVFKHEDMDYSRIILHKNGDK